MLKVKLVDEAATLNNYKNVDVKEYIPNFQFTLNFQILKTETNLRLMPSTSAKLNVLLQLRDGTSLTKAATMKFNPQDTSMWTVSFNATESNNIVGSNFQVFLDMAGDSTLSDLSNASDLESGMAYNVLSKVQFDGLC